jgi:starvation-inducible DNA-binding protein
MVWVQNDDSVHTFNLRKDTGPIVSVVDALNVTIADANTVYHKAHGYHWNVTGQDFTEYHQLFEMIYVDVYESIDPIAENIRKMGAVAPFRMVDLIRLRTIDDAVPATTDALALASALAMDNSKMIATLNMAFDSANAANQQGICNFLAERIDQHQKWDWQLTVSTQ